VTARAISANQLIHSVLQADGSFNQFRAPRGPAGSQAAWTERRPAGGVRFVHCQVGKYPAPLFGDRSSLVRYLAYNPSTNRRLRLSGNLLAHMRTERNSTQPTFRRRSMPASDPPYVPSLRLSHHNWEQGSSKG
jgi:hypothetical protein